MSDQPETDLSAELPRPARRALVCAGFVRLDHFINVSEVDLLKLHGMGPKSLDQLRRALAPGGQSFASTEMKMRSS